MWFSNLSNKQKEDIINNLKADGFHVSLIKDSLVAQKQEQKIIITRLDQTKLVFNLKKWLFSNNFLVKDFDGFDLNSLMSFLNQEKKNTESLFETLSRVSLKLNWGVSSSGILASDNELSLKINADSIEYSEVLTDLGKTFTLISIRNHDRNEFYVINKRFISFYRMLINVSDSLSLEVEAPKTFEYLKTLGFYP